MVQLALCEGDRDGCGLRRAEIPRHRRRRPVARGRARPAKSTAPSISPSGRSATSAQHGEIDVWTSPLATLARGGGDCEDYAIANSSRCAAPVSRRRSQDRGPARYHPCEDHAVAAARLDGRWLTLDNRRMAMVEDADVRKFPADFVIGQDGVMRYADGSLLADTAGNNLWLRSS